MKNLCLHTVIDIDSLIKFHRSHDRILTVTGVRPPGRFGEMESTQDNIVVEFNEKPQAVKGLISGGFFVCRPGLFEYIDSNENVMLEDKPMRKLVKDQQLMVYKHDGFWQPMDTHRDYTLLNMLWDRCNAPWKNW